MNDVIINKVESLQKCIRRAREEKSAAGDNFRNDYTRQDAAILNLTRACEQAIDLANHIIRTKKLGIPKSSAHSFILLADAGIIPSALSTELQRMTGFRNTAIHQYQEIDIAIIEAIISEKSEDLIRYSELLLPFAQS